jgi:hypothetical protein
VLKISYELGETFKVKFSPQKALFRQESHSTREPFVLNNHLKYWNQLCVFFFSSLKLKGKILILNF